MTGHLNHRRERVDKSKSSHSPIIHEVPDSPNKFEIRRKEKLDAIDKIVAKSRLKAQQNRARMAEIEKELTRKQVIRDPALKVPRRKDVYITKPVTISQQVVQPKLPQIDPNDRGKQKVVFKSKKELAKEDQKKMDEELTEKYEAKELKSKQEVLLGKKSPEISSEERNTWHDNQFKAPSAKRTIFFYPDTESYQKIKVIRPTNSFAPPSDSFKENWDIPAPPNGPKSSLWPSAIFPVKSGIDIEEVKKRFFLKKPIQVVSVWLKFKTASISKIDIREFRKMPYAFFQGKGHKTLYSCFLKLISLG
ncbi:unnamed protein product [Lactuca virosa]|uniref:TPX2 C-terminal domain-containing protein n=1 Tax=Lactuca virosa TaxID=75947 RepID=A0AAU9NC32_9ASTR|nr:unnamed protein product [Lactuca virosa]